MELECEPRLSDSRAKLLCCCRGRRDRTHSSTFCTLMERRTVPFHRHWLHTHPSPRTGPRVADGSRAALARQKAKPNQTSGYSLPNTPPVPCPAELKSWGPSPMLNESLETLPSLPSLRLPRSEYWEADIQAQHLTTTLAIVQGSRKAPRVTLTVLLSFLLLLLSYKVATFWLITCVYENTQLSFI